MPSLAYLPFRFAKVLLLAALLSPMFGQAQLSSAAEASTSRYAGTVQAIKPAFNDLASPTERVTAIHIHKGDFFEGPTWVPGKPGYLAYVDIPANRIYRVGTDGKPAILADQIQDGDPGDALPELSGPRKMLGANGTVLDSSGRLTYCVFGGHRIERIEKDGTRTVVVSSHEGKPLLYPNDLVFKSDGTIYYSEHTGLYAYKDGKATRMDGPKAPNGLAFSPDEHYLYVTEHPARIMRFEVLKDGSITNGQVFIDFSKSPAFDPESTFVDGMKVDKDGNVYAVGAEGLWVVTPGGEHIGTVHAPILRFSNLAFGGDDGKTLYLTAPEGLYRLNLASSRVWMTNAGASTRAP